VRLRSLFMALLLITLFAPVAGALYIPGQEIHDDGLVHIMSADTGPASPIQMPAGISLPELGQYAPELMTGDTYSIFLQGFPSQIAGSVPPFIPGVSTGTFAMPTISLPPADEDGNIVVGGTIGHIVPPPTPGYWDNIQEMDLHTNMPVIEVPAMFGI
jgi:hypothetical protein